MKDRDCRRLVDQLAIRMGCAVRELGNPVDGSVLSVVQTGALSVFDAVRRDCATNALLINTRITAIEKKLAAQEESAKPVCKSCGQKIQEGLQVGNVEALAAGLKKGGKK